MRAVTVYSFVIRNAAKSGETNADKSHDLKKKWIILLTLV